MAQAMSATAGTGAQALEGMGPVLIDWPAFEAGLAEVRRAREALRAAGLPVGPQYRIISPYDRFAQERERRSRERDRGKAN
jgi:hypothetical protein